MKGTSFLSGNFFQTRNFRYRVPSTGEAEFFIDTESRFWYLICFMQEVLFEGPFYFWPSYPHLESPIRTFRVDLKWTGSDL
jgi:hypothetical protein